MTRNRNLSTHIVSVIVNVAGSPVVTVLKIVEPATVVVAELMTEVVLTAVDTHVAVLSGNLRAQKLSAAGSAERGRKRS